MAPLGKLNPAATGVFVLCWPDQTCAPELTIWLTLCVGIPVNNIRWMRGSEEKPVSKNEWIERALSSEYDDYLFSERDIRPNPHTSGPLLEAHPDADIACTHYPVKRARAWEGPHPFHTGMWRANRDTLEHIGIPAFFPVLSAGGSRITGCSCGYFAARAARLGVRFAVSGSSHHAVARAPDDGLPDCYRIPNAP